MHAHRYSFAMLSSPKSGTRASDSKTTSSTRSPDPNNSSPSAPSFAAAAAVVVAILVHAPLLKHTRTCPHADGDVDPEAPVVANVVVSCSAEIVVLKAEDVDNVEEVLGAVVGDADVVVVLKEVEEVDAVADDADAVADDADVVAGDVDDVDAVAGDVDDVDAVADDVDAVADDVDAAVAKVDVEIIVMLDTVVTLQVPHKAGQLDCMATSNGGIVHIKIRPAQPGGSTCSLHVGPVAVVSVSLDVVVSGPVVAAAVVDVLLAVLVVVSVVDVVAVV